MNAGIGDDENETGYSSVPGINCTPPAIADFPPDLFTQDERRSGFVVIHFLVSAYIFYAIALVCDDYFVPSIECICDGKLKYKTLKCFGFRFTQIQI